MTPASAKEPEGSGPRGASPRIGVALGGGGAKGLAHLVVLEALEQIGVRPSLIAGTSAGAVVGALVASGQPLATVRERVAKRFLDADESVTKSWTADMPLLKVLSVVDPALGEGGLIRGRTFLNSLLDDIEVRRLEQLPIPLIVTATDYWTRGPVVFERGPLLPAVEASMALPGLVAPIEIDGRLLVDGGLTNPVPFDLLHGKCDIVIAVDVIGKRTPTKEKPTPIDALFGSFQIMEKAIIAEKAARFRPEIYIEPDIRDVRVLEYYRAPEIYTQAEAARDELAKILRELLRK